MLVKNLSSGCRGFTLIELMVVVSVVAILTAIAMPSFVGIFATMRLKTMSGEIQSALTYARSEAMKRNTVVTVTPAAAGWQGGWSITAQGIDTAIQQQGAFTVGAGTITSTFIHPIVFRPNGRSTTPDSFITLTSTKTTVTRCVKIALSGPPVVRETCS